MKSVIELRDEKKLSKRSECFYHLKLVAELLLGFESCKFRLKSGLASVNSYLESTEPCT